MVKFLRMMNNQNTESSKFNELTIIFLVVAAVFILLTIFLAIAYVRLKKKYNIYISQTQAYVNSVNTERDNIINALNEQNSREIFAIREDCAEKVTQAKQEVDAAKKEIEDVKKEYQYKIRNIIEKLLVQRADLEKKKEREILIDIMMTLYGYAGRLDRLEQQLSEEQIINRITKMSDDFNNSIDYTKSYLSNQISEMSASLNKEIKLSELQQKLLYVKDTISNQIINTNDSLSRKINDMNANLSNSIRESDIQQRISYFGDQLSNKVDNMNNMIRETLNNSDFDRLDNRLNRLIKYFTDEDDYDGFAYAFNEMKSQISDLNDYTYRINSNFDDIKSEVDQINRSISNEFDSDSISSYLREIKDAVDDAVKAARDARDAIEYR